LICRSSSGRLIAGARSPHERRGIEAFAERNLQRFGAFAAHKLNGDDGARAIFLNFGKELARRSESQPCSPIEMTSPALSPARSAAESGMIFCISTPRGACVCTTPSRGLRALSSLPVFCRH
jgi:hypothetical protein